MTKVVERTYNAGRYVREKNGGSGGPDSTQADDNYRIWNKVDSSSPTLASSLMPQLTAELRSEAQETEERR